MLETLRLCNEQLFFDDPVIIGNETIANIGLFASNQGLGGIRQCGDGIKQPDAVFGVDDYTLYGPVYDDGIMRQAVINLGGIGLVPDGYCLIGNNCQNYGDALREEYVRLVGQSQGPPSAP